MHPIQLIFSFFANIVTWGIVAVNVYFVREWYYHKDIAGDEEYVKWCIAFSVVAFIFSIGGKFIFRLFLGRKGDDEPNRIRSANTQVIERDGHAIHLEFYGDKNAQPIIFIHGWSSDSTQWYYLKKHLSVHYYLILMDLPGCGNSSKKKNGAYSPERFALDLDEVVKLTGDKKPLIAGHSIGGMTILSYCKLFATDLANRVSGLALIQTTYTNPVKTSIFNTLLTAIEKPVLRPLCHLIIGIAPIVQLMNWVKYLNGSMHVSNHLTGYAGTETKGQLELTSFLSTISAVGPMARGMLGMFKYDATNTLPFIKVPVLVIAGDKDILCKPVASEYIAQKIPGSQFHLLKNCGHMGPMEQNQDMVNAMDVFANSLQAASAARQKPEHII